MAMLKVPMRLVVEQYGDSIEDVWATQAALILPVFLRFYLYHSFLSVALTAFLLGT